MKIEGKFKSENSEELRKEAEEHAQKTGIKLNPKDKIVETIMKGLLKNKESKGENYCPCRIVSGDKEEDKKIICPCIYHKKEIEVDGHCKCYLFVS